MRAVVRHRGWSSLLVLLGFLAAALAVGYLGGRVTAPNIPGWFEGLKKPPFNPPNGVFMPVWTTLYVLMAVAAWRVWRKAGMGSRALAFWVAQLVLNLAWSFIFFGAHALFAAFVELLVLWLAILSTMLAFRRIDRPAAWLMLPYLAWVSFAGLLNGAIWRLNG